MEERPKRSRAFMAALLAQKPTPGELLASKLDAPTIRTEDLSLNRRQQCDARRGKKYGDDDGLNRAQKYIVMMTNAPAKGSRSDGHKRTKQSVDSRRGDASKDSHPQET